MKRKKKLVIISEKTRYHFQQPLEYFKDFEVHHLTKKTFKDMDAGSFDSIEFYSGVFDLYRKLKKIKPDVIQSLEPYYGYSRFKVPVRILPIIFCTMIFSKAYNTKYFFHVLENVPVKNKYGWAWPFMKFIARKYSEGASFIYYLNQGAKENLKELGVLSKSSKSLWGIWGVDISIFKPSKTKGKYITFVGSLSERKGFDDFLYVARNVDMPIVIVGDGPMRLQAKQIAEENKNITYLGSVNSQNIPNIIRDAKVIIFPSKTTKYSTEQVGMVAIEAMACGVPVVGYDSGSISEFVSDKAAILIEEGDRQGLLLSTRKVANNSEIHSKMSDSGRNYSLKNYNSKENIEAIEKDLIKRLVN